MCLQAGGQSYSAIVFVLKPKPSAISRTPFPVKNQPNFCHKYWKNRLAYRWRNTVYTDRLVFNKCKVLNSSFIWHWKHCVHLCDLHCVDGSLCFWFLIVFLTNPKFPYCLLLGIVFLVWYGRKFPYGLVCLISFMHYFFKLLTRFIVFTKIALFTTVLLPS